MAFSWIQVPSNGAAVTTFTNIMLGGFSYFLGAPRGVAHITDGIGWNAAVSGHSLQFFTSSNDLVATDTQKTTCRELANWVPEPGALFDGQFVTNIFVRFKLIQRMQGSDGVFDLTWGPSFSVTNEWIIPNYPDYPAYFGVSAATGPIGTSHDVKHFALYGTPVPEPTTVVATLAFLALAWRRR